MSFTNLPPQSIVESIHYDEWVVCNFKIVFLFSERILTLIKKASLATNWYEDPVVASTYIEQVNTCFISIRQFYNAFGVLPQIGDRLYDEDTGLAIVGRSIDGDLMTVTFVLGL
ncbi:MAG: hypothetical protein EOO61_07495 [Hymenobacter sp.]|nr:MAG: hypothetical protein EOO61_07495 [Hymenobacter sp.]